MSWLSSFFELSRPVWKSADVLGHTVFWQTYSPQNLRGAFHDKHNTIKCNTTDDLLCVCTWLCSGGLCVWLAASQQQRRAPAASPRPAVGNHLCVIVCAMNCWWRICLCARLNNGNIKYLVQIIIIIHFLATAKKKKNMTNHAKIKNKQRSCETIVFGGNDEELRAHALCGEHYLRFMWIRPLRLNGPFIFVTGLWKFCILNVCGINAAHLCCVFSSSSGTETLITILNLCLAAKAPSQSASSLETFKPAI